MRVCMSLSLDEFFYVSGQLGHLVGEIQQLLCQDLAAEIISPLWVRLQDRDEIPEVSDALCHSKSLRTSLLGL